MFKDLLNNLMLSNKTDDLHFSTTFRATEWIHLIYLSDTLTPFARALPVGTDLVVKPHPHFMGSDYSVLGFQKLKKNHNVRIVDPNENNIELITNSLGVITINSGAGYEAIILNKPVITLGNVFYAKEDISINIRDLKELPETLLDVGCNPEFEVDFEQRKKFIALYYVNSFPLKQKQYLNEALDEDDKQKVIEKYNQMEVAM